MLPANTLSRKYFFSLRRNKIQVHCLCAHPDIRQKYLRYWFIFWLAVLNNMGCDFAEYFTIYNQRCCAVTRQEGSQGGPRPVLAKYFAEAWQRGTNRIHSLRVNKDLRSVKFVFLGVQFFQAINRAAAPWVPRAAIVSSVIDETKMFNSSRKSDGQSASEVRQQQR